MGRNKHAPKCTQHGFRLSEAKGEKKLQAQSFYFNMDQGK